MNKALEILKDIQDSKWCGVKPTLVKWKLEDFNEAIKELEELQNRSCDTCKSKFCSIKRILTREDEMNSNYFYCNDWENKA